MKNATGRRYTIKEKYEALKLAELVGYRKAARQLGITVNSLLRWKKNKEYYKEYVNNSGDNTEDSNINNIVDINSRIIKFIGKFTKRILKEFDNYTEEQIIGIAKLLLPIYVKISGLDKTENEYEATLHKFKIEVIPNNENK